MFQAFHCNFVSLSNCDLSFKNVHYIYININFQNEKLDDYDFVPTLKKKSSKAKEETEFKGLLGDDDDDEDDEQVTRVDNPLDIYFKKLQCLL